MGKNGGFILGKPADSIKVADVIEAAIGPINVVDCVDHPETCGLADQCECRCVFQTVNQKIKEVLSSYTLAQLVDQRARAPRKKTATA